MKVLEAMPVDQSAYRPHERSPSALDLMWTLANEMAACTTMIDRGEVRWEPPPAPLPREAVRVFQADYEALDERVNRLGDEAWLRAESHGFHSAKDFHDVSRAVRGVPPGSRHQSCARPSLGPC